MNIPVESKYNNRKGLVTLGDVSVSKVPVPSLRL